MSTLAYLLMTMEVIRGELDKFLLKENQTLLFQTITEFLARLPIQIYWTTNYDRLIEKKHF
jgi:hypothetical protein